MSVFEEYGDFKHIQPALMSLNSVKPAVSCIAIS